MTRRERYKRELKQVEQQVEMLASDLRYYRNKIAEMLDGTDTYMAEHIERYARRYTATYEKLDRARENREQLKWIAGEADSRQSIAELMASLEEVQA